MEQLLLNFLDWDAAIQEDAKTPERVRTSIIKTKKTNKPTKPVMPKFLKDITSNGSLEDFLKLFGITNLRYSRYLFSIHGNTIYNKDIPNNGGYICFQNDEDKEDRYGRNSYLKTNIAYFDENGQMWVNKIHLEFNENIISGLTSWNNKRFTFTCTDFSLDNWTTPRLQKLMHGMSFLQDKETLFSILENVNPYTAAWAKTIHADPQNLLMAPQIETLYKAGYDFAKGFLSYGRFNSDDCDYFNRLCAVGSKPKTIFKTSKVIYSVLKNETDMEVWDCYRRLDKTGKIKEDNVAQAYGQHYSAKDLNHINSILAKQYNDKPVFTWDTLINYLGRLDTFEAIDKQEAFILLNDYLSMCSQLQMEPRIDGDSLKREHDIAARNCRNKRDEILNQQMTENLEKMKKYNYKEGVYFVRAITSHDDLLDEANQQHNCVGSYGYSIAEGTSYIYVMREVARPNQSLITIELAPNGKTIRQKYLAYNRPIHNKSQSDFIDRWLKYCKSISE